MKTYSRTSEGGCLRWIVAGIVFFTMAYFFGGCRPTKSTLKQQIATQNETINVLQQNSERVVASLSATERQRDSLKQEFSILEKQYFSLENENKTLSEKLLTNFWYRYYYESGVLKAEGGTTSEKTTQTAETKQTAQETDYREKYLASLQNSETEHNMKLNYARENDSLRQVISEISNLQSDTQTTETRGLSWWQKTQIIGFWAMAAVWCGRWALGGGLLTKIWQFIKSLLDKIKPLY